LPQGPESVSNAWDMIKLLLAGATTLTLSTPAWAAAPKQHDGLYVRIGGGLGYVSDSFESEDLPLLGTVEGTITGLAIPFEFAAGTSIKPGLVLGGGMYLHYVPSPTAEEAQSAVGQGDVDFDSGLFVLFGPMIDYYLDPRMGLHLQGSVGLGYFSIGDGEVQNFPISIEGADGLGFGAMIGFGNEWWVTDDWSMGVLARLAFGITGAESEDGIKSDHSVWTPALLFTVTLN
jgi:hypothetical protein